MVFLFLYPATLRLRSRSQRCEFSQRALPQSESVVLSTQVMKSDDDFHVSINIYDPESLRLKWVYPPNNDDIFPPLMSQLSHKWLWAPHLLVLPSFDITYRLLWSFVHSPWISSLQQRFSMRLVFSSPSSLGAKQVFSSDIIITHKCSPLQSHRKWKNVLIFLHSSPHFSFFSISKVTQLVSFEMHFRSFPKVKAFSRNVIELSKIRWEVMEHGRRRKEKEREIPIEEER